MLVEWIIVGLIGVVMWLLFRVSHLLNVIDRLKDLIDRINK
jgi:hypothetical protein